MGPKTIRLVKLIDSAVSLMISVEERHWASWLEKDAQYIRADDSYGIKHFLSAFGGMGSINDLIIHPMNGHHIKDSEIESINNQLQTLLSESYDIAYEISSEANIR